MTQDADHSWRLLNSIANALQNPSFFDFVRSKEDGTYAVNLVVYETKSQQGQPSFQSIYLGQLEKLEGASRNPWIAIREELQIILDLQHRAKHLGYERAFAEALLDLLFKVTDRRPRPSEANIEALLNAVTPLLDWGSA